MPFELIAHQYFPGLQMEKIKPQNGDVLSNSAMVIKVKNMPTLHPYNSTSGDLFSYISIIIYCSIIILNN